MAGPLRSTDVTPLHRYCGPSRHPLVFGRLPGFAGYTAYPAPAISRRDEEGFSSCSACPCHRAVASTPPRCPAVSVSVRLAILPSPLRVAARNRNVANAQSRAVFDAQSVRTSGASNACCLRLGLRSLRQTRDRKSRRTLSETRRRDAKAVAKQWGVTPKGGRPGHGTASIVCLVIGPCGG
jgi:hypothetical protein